MISYEGFDFKNPDYPAVFKRRLKFYNNLKAHPERIPAIKAYYRDHIADFINDWGCTFVYQGNLAIVSGVVTELRCILWTSRLRLNVLSWLSPRYLIPRIAALIYRLLMAWAMHLLRDEVYDLHHTQFRWPA
jgi:hypothetical protein